MTGDPHRYEIIRGGMELAPLLAEMHGQCFPDGWSADNFASILVNRGADGFILSDGGGPLGFCVIQQAVDEAEILTIGVLPDRRQGGLGAVLLSSVMDRLRIAGCGALFLEVADDNHPAIALYNSAGFLAAGRRKGYYRLTDGGRQDALVLRRDFAGP
mgnify:CR=1 FL=1